MNNLYCPECGDKNEYSIKKPKFCSSCGEAFGGIKIQPSPLGQTSTARQNVPHETVDYKNIQDFKVDVVMPNPNDGKQKIENLFYSPVDPNSISYAEDPKGKKRAKRISLKEFADRSIEECKLKRKDIDG